MNIGGTAEVVIAAIASGGVVIASLKHKAIVAFFRQTHTTTASAVEVVELLRAEIEELRTQRDEDRVRLAAQDKEIERLSNELNVLSRQITAEEPIRALTLKIDEHIAQVNEVLQYLEKP